MPTAGDFNHWQSDERHLCVGKQGFAAAKRWEDVEITRGTV